MIQAIQLKKKTYIEYESELYCVLDHHHVKPGKGGAFVKAKLKCLTKPMIVTKTFRSEEKLKEIQLEHITVEVLYFTDIDVIFMNMSTHEQYNLSKEYLEKDIQFLKPGLELTLSFYQDKVIDFNLPTSVNLEVIYTEPAVKGNTTVNAFKKAKLETGYEIKVPLFVNNNDIIQVDTKNGEYMTRIS